MKHSLGTIKIEAQLQEPRDNTIESLSDITSKYSGLGQKQKEHFYAVFLTNNNTEIGDKLIGLGGRNSTPVDIQDVVRTATLVNAAAVILIHNHPSNNTEPTQQDIETTQEIHDVLEKINIELLDHVIISKTENYSMREANDGPF